MNDNISEIFCLVNKIVFSVFIGGLLIKKSVVCGESCNWNIVVGFYGIDEYKFG